MKAIPTKKVKSVLRSLDLRETQGNGTGHEIWIDSTGKQIHPVLRQKDMTFFSLFCLGRELEIKEICDRRSFINAVKMA